MLSWFKVKHHLKLPGQRMRLYLDTRPLLRGKKKKEFYSIRPFGRESIVEGRQAADA